MKQHIANHATLLDKSFILQVPDRGGRPSSEAPPPEMPAFKQRTEPSRDQRGGK